MRLLTRVAALGLTLAVVPVAVVGLLAYRDARRYLLDAEVRRLTTSSALKQGELLDWFGDNERNLALLADRPLVRDYAIALRSQDPGSEAFAAAHRLLLEEHLRPYTGAVGWFEVLSLLDPESGRVLASTDGSLENQSQKLQPYFQRGREGVYTETVAFDPDRNLAAVRVGAPVRARDGRVVAVLGAHVDRLEMSGILARGQEGSRTEKTYLFNPARLLVAESRLASGPSLRSLAPTPGAEACLQGSDGVEFYADPQGMPVIGAYQWLPEQRLCLLTEEEQTAAIAPALEMRTTALVAAAAVAGLAALLAWLFARALTRPLARLAEGARIVGTGNLSHRLGISGSGEEAEVARAFDDMIASLDRMTASRDEYEAEVARRQQVEARLNETLEDLGRSNRELEQFAYVASHDLQEPLRMVASYVQLLERRYKGRLDADADEFIHFAVDGAMRMKRLIQDLLVYSRVGTKGRPLAPTPADAALDQALENLGAALQDSGGEVVREPLPVVMADSGQLTQLFQNLLSNALKFAAADTPPKVAISAERDGDRWVFSVRDNGIGIDPQFTERIFVIFQRLHGKDEYPGTGIGLALCKKIVERHGGRLWVESQPDCGTTFRFSLAGVEATLPDEMGQAEPAAVGSEAAA